MEIENMTPEELREYAAEKESARKALTDRYMGREPGRNDGFKVVTDGAKPWERKVECDGETFWVDMRRLRSREFIRRSAAMQDRDPSISEQLDLFEFVFEGSVQEQVERLVERRLGYVDYVEVLEIEGEILELVDAKN